MLNSSGSQFKIIKFTNCMKATTRYIIVTIIACFFLHLTGAAQFKSAVIGVDGLTCSACSFATQKSLLELKSVDSVYMQLEQNTATVFFKTGEKVSVKDLAKKVTDAGFSVRSITATIEIKELNVTPGYCWNYENDTYHLKKLDASTKLNGDVQFIFIGKRYMSATEYRKWMMYAKDTCPSNGAKTPYSEDYYVTIQ